MRCAAPFGNRPDDQRRPAMGISADEYARGGRLPVRTARQRPTTVQLQPEPVEQRHVLDTVEPDRQQGEVAGDLQRSSDRGDEATAVGITGDPHLLDLDRANMASVVADESLN